MDILQARRKATAATTKIIAGVKSDQWADDTPCDEWNVRDVINHLTNENLWVPDMVAGRTIEEVGDAYDGDVLGDDPAGHYASTATKADEAFEQPGALTRDIPVSYGPVPGEVYAGHHFLDTVIHGWDIAKATGQDTTIDPELVDFLIVLLAPQLEMLKKSGAFKVIDVPDDAEPQTRLLAMVGRTP